MKALEHIHLLNLDTNQEFMVNGLISGLLDPLGFMSAQRWVRQCYNTPYHVELVLKALDEVLDGCGVESIPHPEGDCNPLAVYVNNGHTYQATIVLPYSGIYWWENRGAYEVNSWGDFYESWVKEQAENGITQCPHCSHLSEFDNLLQTGQFSACPNCEHER